MYHVYMLAPSKCISIHAWGGLGSQLFAVALSLDLKKSFPSRCSVLKLHTSGVTSRVSEIDSIFPEFSIDQISDFSLGGNESRFLKCNFFLIFKKFFSSLANKLFHYFGFINNCNTDAAFAKVRPWIIGTRGHYAHRKISISSLSFLSERLTSFSDQNVQMNEKNEILAVHYRLGDLISLDNKNPVSVQGLSSEIQRFVQTWKPTKIIIYSDSPETAGRNLGSFNLGAQLEARDLPAPEVIREACNAKYFIGSNSKISFWIVGLRLFYSPFLQNSLPKGNRINWIQCSDFELDYSNVSEYL